MQRKSIIEALSDEKIVSFTKEIIKTSYVRFFRNHKKEIDDMVDVAFRLIVENQKKRRSISGLSKTASLIGRTIFHVHDPSFWFGIMQQNYSRHIRVFKDFSTIEPYIKGKRILDFGSDGGHFALELSRDGYGVYTTDVLDNRIPEASHLPFHEMSGPTDIPYKNNSIDTVIIKTVLHHINSENLAIVLNKLRRVASRLIIEEDVFDISKEKDTKIFVNTQFGMDRFSTFTREEQYLYLVINDYFTNAVIYERSKINFPFTFHSLKEWNAILNKAGFKVIKHIYNGFPDWKLTKNSQAWIVCDRIKEA